MVTEVPFPPVLVKIIFHVIKVSINVVSSAHESFHCAGQQMEQEGKEWVCPKCKKMERAMKGVVVLGKKRMEGQLTSPTVKLEQGQLSPTKSVKRIIISQPEEAENQVEVKKPEVKKSPDGVKRLGGLSGFTIPKKVNVVHEAITPPKKILSDEKKVTSPQVIKLSQRKMFEGREVSQSDTHSALIDSQSSL